MLALTTNATVVLPAAPRARPTAVAAPARTCAGTEVRRRGGAEGRPRSRGPPRHADRREVAEDRRGTVASNGNIGGFATPLLPPDRRAAVAPPDRRIDPLRGVSCESLNFHRAAVQKSTLHASAI